MTLGSYFGGILSIVFVLIMFIRFVTLFEAMMLGSNDIINQIITKNDFEADEKTNLVDVNKQNFMPYLEIVRLNNDHPDEAFDIFKEDKVTGKKVIDASKVQNYIETLVRFKIIKKTKDKGKLDLNNYQTMRNCRQEDFERRNFNASAISLSSLICPDVSDNYEKYVVENGYTNKELRKSFSIEAYACMKEYNPKCKSREEVEMFLSTFYFNLYTLT